MLKFFSWFSMLQIVVSLRIEFSTTEKFHISSCLRTIIQQNFIHGQPVLISSPNSDDAMWIEFILRHLNEAKLWPLYVSQGETEHINLAKLATKPQGYVIFMCPGGEVGDVSETLVEQVKALKSWPSWNQRGNFVILLAARHSGPPHLLALKIAQTLWISTITVNVVILIPNSEAFTIKDSANEKVTNLDVYTWFPYQEGRCAEPLEVVTVDQCILEGNGNLSKNVSVFSNRIPNNLQGCPLRVTARANEPYVIQTSTDFGTGGSTTYKYRGLNIEHILLFSEATNMTVQFLPPAEGTLLDAQTQQYVDIYIRSADVAAGSFFLNSRLSEYADPTIPFVFDKVKWHVPCPRPATKMEKIMSVFSLSSWLCMAVVFFLTSLVFWRSANGPHISVTMESQYFKCVLNCVYFVWCVFIGVSVPELPRTWKLRIWFLLFVWYCFVLNTVFQALFITFLVEPGYNKQIKTIEELNESRLPYCLDSNSRKHHELISYSEYEDFQSRPLDLGSLKECLEYFFINGNITLLSPLRYTRFIASLLGLFQNGNKLFCTLDQDEYFIYGAMYLSQGHPLLGRFNTLMRRFVETGLVSKYSSQLNFQVYLRNMNVRNERECEASSNTYLVLSLFHLRVMFVVLAFGYISSVTAFVGELICKWYVKQRAVTK
jgi:hypothetical protein